ncbi:biotin carboxylase N-terminal domain-containing protein, partial [Klebsiella pneumoniae subsp. pneumoniae]
MFDTLLIANRGEIACRVAATARRLGIRTVAVYSDADANARHVAACDIAVHIGGPEPRASYLRADAILQAARDTGAQAIHPGYGFLSENEAFAEAAEQAGIAFVGPPARPSPPWAGVMRRVRVLDALRSSLQRSQRMIPVWITPCSIP